MNSIQFITNQVGRVIGTPPQTPRRSPSTSSLYSAEAATTERPGTISSGKDLDEVSNRLAEELLLKPIQYSNTHFRESDETEFLLPEKDQNVDNDTPRKENIVFYTLLFPFRLFIWIVTSPFLWLSSLFRSDTPVEDLTASQTQNNKAAYVSIFGSLASLFRSSATKGHQSQSGTIEKNVQSNLSNVIEETPHDSQGSAISMNLRSPYAALRLPTNSINTPITASGTPKPKNRKGLISYAFRYPRSLAPPRPLLSQPSPKSPLMKEKKTLVLDLDETLIHSIFRSGAGFPQGHMIEVKLQNSQFATLYNVLKRPYCDEFLDIVSQWYNLVMFTASVQAYADPMIDWLESDRKYFQQRLYRQHCTFHTSSTTTAPTQPETRPADATPETFGYVKDITKVSTDLSKVLIIDNSPVSFLNHESNAIEIDTWINDPSDTSLLSLIPLLSALRYTTDVRTVLSLKSGEAMFC